jgi:hypothetical protein
MDLVWLLCTKEALLYTIRIDLNMCLYKTCLHHGQEIVFLLYKAVHWLICLLVYVICLVIYMVLPNSIFEM